MDNLKILAEMKDILDKANIQYWMDCGSLLHLYRDKTLPKDDIDFGILMVEYSKVKEFIVTHPLVFTSVHIRTRELSLRYKDQKFDFICYEDKGDNLYLYAYKQNPHTYNKWNWEWRAIFPKDVYLPTKPMILCGIEFNVPNNIEKRLELQYGKTWRTPVNIPSWTYDLNESRDQSYHPIAVVMTTFLRDETMFKVLPSYLQYPIKLYLLDQGHHTEAKDKYYTQLRQAGHCVEYSDFDIGLSMARNILLDKVDQEFVLLTEDDIELTTNPYSLLQKFSNNNLGVLGGLLYRENDVEQHYEYALEIKDKILTYKKSEDIDIVLNFFLAKRKVFDEVRYDNSLPLAEHTDFFINLKQNGNWKVEYSRELMGNHFRIDNPKYKEYRDRAKNFVAQMKKKWNITKIVQDNKVISENEAELTVFVLTCGEDLNYTQCLAALQKQSIVFDLEIIKDVHPMSKAFQAMLDKCTTKYFIQVDSDMILNPNAVSILYSAILKTKEQEAMVCFKLLDCHLNKPIDGIKIYKRSIFKDYPYQNTLSCEMEQLERMQKEGFTYIRNSDVIGSHCPQWTEEGIFNRYYTMINKMKKINSSGATLIINKLLSIFKSNPTPLNLYAFLGGVSSIVSNKMLKLDRDYSKPLTKEFPILQEIFKLNNYIVPTPKISVPKNRTLVLQISSSPCANRPLEISKLIAQYSTKYYSRHILGSQYGRKHPDVPYREFPIDLWWGEHQSECVALIKQAKIIHVHHNIPDKLLGYIDKTKQSIVWTVSNISQSLKVHGGNFNKEYHARMIKIANRITTTDEPLQKQVYDYIKLFYLPIIKCDFNIYEKNNPIPKIIFAPTNKTTILDSTKYVTKGYNEVLAIMEELKQEKLQFEFILLEGVPYEENIKIKKTADIMIDDVCSPTFHGTSIEALCFGALCLTGYSDENYPFIKTTLKDLKETLKYYITNYDKLKSAQKQLLIWKKANYTPEKLLAPYESLYDKLLDRH